MPSNFPFPETSKRRNADDGLDKALRDLGSVHAIVGRDDENVSCANIRVVWHTKKGVKTAQMIEVFVKYVNDHPENLNKPANEVLFASAVQGGLYSMKVTKEAK